jgi:predicted RecB family nuclease
VSPKPKRELRICPKGHKYYKSSNCPTCPSCEAERKPEKGFLSKITAPARRALEDKGITTLKQLSQYTEGEILELHGIGKTSIPKLKSALKSEGLKFKG